MQSAYYVPMLIWLRAISVNSEKSLCSFQLLLSLVISEVENSVLKVKGISDKLGKVSEENRRYWLTGKYLGNFKANFY